MHWNSEILKTQRNSNTTHIFFRKCKILHCFSCSMWRMAIERHLQSIHGLTHYMTLAVFKLCILCTLTEGHPTVLLTGAKRKCLMSFTKIWYWAKPHKVEWTSATLPRHLFQSVQPIGDADLWQSGQCPGGPRSSLQHNASPRLISYLSCTSNVYHWVSV